MAATEGDGVVVLGALELVVDGHDDVEVVVEVEVDVDHAIAA